MANHNIYVGIKNDTQTTTAFPVDKNDHVFFHNRGEAELTVTFDDPNGEGPFCKKGNESQVTFKVPAKSTSDMLKVCKDAGDFAYTAQIAGFAAEDPIVIIERPHVAFPIDTVSLAIGLAAGLIAGFFLARLMKGSRPRMPA